MYTLAIIPSVVLLIYIYKKDKKEKEPMGMLIRLFLLGALVALPICLVETIIGEFVEAVTTIGSVANAILEAFVVAALCEETGKYLVMKKITFKRHEFNCTFDGIVYAVFTSLGFATLENIAYVMDGGISTAIYRMFSSIPGHMCFAVFMGYYYSLCKRAQLNGDHKTFKKNRKKALFVPIILHGIYDTLIMVDEEVVGSFISSITLLEWYIFVIALFIFTFKFVKKASDSDAWL